MNRESLNRVFENYLSKHSFDLVKLPVFSGFIPDAVVVIPCYNESGISDSLLSLIQNSKPNYLILIIVVINAPENATEDIKKQNVHTYNECTEMSLHCPDHICIHPLLLNCLPQKLAGVGLARKIGMDEAVKIFLQGSKEGVIICFDADSLCSSDLCKNIIEYFKSFDNIDAVSIYFEHPLQGDSFSTTIYQAITQYELHLRYYINAQRYIGLPYAFQTIGSSMAVKASSYCLYGGMNKRKAGEDFYFLHKFISKGKFGEINNAVVFPSPRISDRVPFGTGRAVGDLINIEASEFLTYDFRTFEELSFLTDHLSGIYIEGWEKYSEIIPKNVVAYFNNQGIGEKLEELKRHTSDYISFNRRFYQWFDAFALMKFVHFWRDHYYPNVSAQIAAYTLGSHIFENTNIKKDALNLLMKYRERDKSTNVAK
ncbi:MAG: glycosyltransferase family 2 protein [Saprospiraceae bacterium]|nr:glycosyltransferase family 2 protein [Saprospiraceae bacterium]